MLQTKSNRTQSSICFGVSNEGTSSLSSSTLDDLTTFTLDVSCERSTTLVELLDVDTEEAEEEAEAPEETDCLGVGFTSSSESSMIGLGKRMVN